eukprot:TRINITY_DN1999_c1_g1_i1.p1 TRINITY_DN1999_c1_g1~~TRINITY_DN1999_c1_g1_i1.p1  ORF type:complete len:519 (+),score=137.55 TRINITY_DN1999_c1_g1_i1:86-1642(+)
MTKDAADPSQTTTATTATTTTATNAEASEKQSAALLTGVLPDLRAAVTNIEKGVQTKENRHIVKVLRQLNTIRRSVQLSHLRRFVQVTIADQPRRAALLRFLPLTVANQAEADAMEAEEDVSMTSPPTEQKEKRRKDVTLKISQLPEVEAYTNLLVVAYLIDQKKYNEAKESASGLVAFISTQSRRTMDELAAKAYFFYSRTHELTNTLQDIRSELVAAFRTASLRHDDTTKATLINLLLRNYMHYNLYDQAVKFLAKTKFPENTTNNELARYLYYDGRIKAIQLEYTAAYGCLLQASRKAPQKAARGFRLTVHKLSCIVQLLLGDMPERGIFQQPDLAAGLAPYLEITQAVKDGALASFHEAMEKYKSVFVADKNYNLIMRLRHNVIKTGLRKINLAYSRISFVDICSKLNLGSPEDAESIVAKAIKDGVIDATIDHEKGFMHSKGNTDIYSTTEPQAALHKRVAFCLHIHNEAVKAMRFPPNSQKKDSESPEERKERELQEAELARSLAEEEDEDY